MSTTRWNLSIEQAITDMLVTKALVLEIMYLGTWEGFLATMDEFNALPRAVRHNAKLSLTFTSRAARPELNFGPNADTRPLTRIQAKRVLDVLQRSFAYNHSREQLMAFWKEEKRVFGPLRAADISSDDDE